MQFEEIKPFARYVRILKISENSKFDKVLPLDARLFYLQSGRETVRIDGANVRLFPGDLLFVNSGIPYELSPDNATLLAVNFDFTNAHQYRNQPIAPVPAAQTDKCRLVEHIAFDDAPEFDSYILVKNVHSVETDLTKLLNEFEKKRKCSDLINSSLLALILIRIFRTAGKNGTQKCLDIATVIEYIHENYANEKLDNEQIAAVFGYHPNYLNAAFKEATGHTIHRYLLQTRMAASVPLMECGEYSVGEIAESCGFADANYFSKAFKRVIGCSPTAFKKSER